MFNYQAIKLMSLATCLMFCLSCLPKKVIQSTPPLQRHYGKPYKISNQWYYPMTYVNYFEQRGLASWYGKQFHGRKTSNGETYDMYGISAAHKTLPLGTYVKVYNLENKKYLVVRINDRGPFIKGRIIDLSYGAAQKLGIVQKGTANVFIRTVSKPTHAKGIIVVKKKRPKKSVRPIKKAVKEKNSPVMFGQGNCFQIQVGAFSNRQNAQSLSNRLRPLYNDSHILLSQSNGKPLYRVMIGNCMPQQKAVYVERQLGHHGFQDAFVVTQVRR
ncbi:MAG: rare lipoprotein A [Candidatus Magnetoglobus multicellularis str. Araruama]|uniref:Probable endolytic peptidoglycan transglycosylase RlpA n=1 Tax=Candidatus Magnetoglobus multicellularis str. Araruama TaxID=890399 RepID=A0A1V1PAY5_9BACT|nr:MAG: rare lipoprotein A [Candidatus Magnetoglobus multicellularis str. Araruama]